MVAGARTDAAADDPAGRDAAPSPRPAPRSPRATSLLLMGVALALFFAPALLGRGQLLYRDSGRMHWPVKRYVAERLRDGHLPQWNPYAGLGAPLVSGGIDAVQHPFNLLLLTLPFELAFKLWALLSYALAAYGAYAWARALGRSRIAAAAAGLGFALSGALVGASDNLTYLTTLAAIPWIFAAAHRWLARPGPLALAAVGLASALCAAGGDPQAWAFAVVLLPLYAVFVAGGSGRRWRDAARGLAAAGAAVAGAAPVILPVLAWMPGSSRGNALDPAELQRWNLPLPRLLELVLPHMYRDAPGTMLSQVYVAFGGGASPIPWVASVYVGASVAALAVLAAARSRPVRWLLVCAAGFTWLAMGPGGGLGWLLAHAPVLNGFRYWEKMAIWPALLLPIAAAHGLDEVVAGRIGRRALLAVAALGLAAVALHGVGAAFPGVVAHALERPGVAPAVAGAFADNLQEGLLEAGLVTLLLGLAALAVERGLVRRAAAPLLALVLVGDVFAANIRGYQLADPAIVEQPAPLAEPVRAQPGLQRVLAPIDLTRDKLPGLRDFESSWLWAGRTLSSCFNLDHRIGNFETYAGMVPARADLFRRRLPAPRLVPQVGMFGVGYLVVQGSPESASAVGLAPPFDVVAADPALPAFLLRFPHRPRAYLASDVAQVDRRGAMEFALAGDPGSTQRSVVEAPVPGDYRPPAGSARVVLDEPERVAVETTADGQALLVLNDIVASGWSATVDGQPAPILPANYLVRGVWVEGGGHRVEFAYRTPGLRLGWAIFLLSATATAVTGLRAALRRRRR